MDKGILLREYHSEDCAKIMQLFYDTIHSVNAADYNENQLDAWAPKEIDMACWDSRFLQDHAVVAEKDNIIVGIGTLKGSGYFDLLYIHKDYQRIGIATSIADEIERHFRYSGIPTVTTDASITAKRFFENRGYVVLKEQSVEIRGQFLTNFKMQKIF